MSISRRQWWQAAIAPLLGGALPKGLWAQAPLEANPFTLGVASGAPTESSVVLWTRLMPTNPYRNPWADLPLEVRWELALDEGFKHLVQSGAHTALPALAHTVHVEVSGLAASQALFYRFSVAGFTSPIGRTRTLPRPQDELARLRLAFASCQRYHAGHFGAYRAMLADQPDVVIFLGDYIYESGGRVGEFRGPVSAAATALNDYRELYALAHSDPALQAMHAACPWLLTWDDHEVFNDYAGGPLQGDARFGSVGRRRAAYQAWYEHMPVSPRSLIGGLQGLLQGPAAIQVYQRVPVGRLAMIHLLDTRQYRDDAVRCGIAGLFKQEDCEAASDPARSLLGRAQETWLQQGLQQQSPAHAATRQHWNLLCQPTTVSRRLLPVLGERSFSDGWDGYVATRDRLIQGLQTHAVSGPVILGGDIHEHWAAHLHAGPGATQGPIVAPEFCCTSITSRAFGGLTSAEIMALNPHVQFSARQQRGYGLITLTPQAAQVQMRVIDDVFKEWPSVSTAAQFEVAAGNLHMRRV